MSEVYKLNELTPDEGSSSQNNNNIAKLVNRSDLAEPCQQLTEDCDYQCTLEFLDYFDVWYAAAFPGCNDLGRKKSELYYKLSRNPKTELVNYDFNTENLEKLRQAILDRIERKYPAKKRILTFLGQTKHKNDQTLAEYFALSHRQAKESGMHSGDWTSEDIEVLILLAGMKNPCQHSKLLYEHHDKVKITFEDLQKFANIEESIEKQATKSNKSATFNSIAKGKGKPAAKQTPKKSAANEGNTENKCAK